MIPVSTVLYPKLSIAPMIDWTYTHFRVFMRLLAPKALLYTEMQTSGAILNNPMKALDNSFLEHPVAIQLGGSDPFALAQSARAAEKAGFDEINLNLGCPSDKVQAGHFGACLMKEPDKVMACISEIKKTVSIPVSAKTRIGVDDQDSYSFFSTFVHKLIDAGCEKIIVHARKAWLHGLNPKQNRTIPPVHYDYVYRIKQELPTIPVIINGNILNYQEITEHLNYVDGVMLGRLACDNPYQIALIHQSLYPHLNRVSRSEVLGIYRDYLLNEYQKGISLSVLVKPLFNLAHGLPGARVWKKKLMDLMQSKQLEYLDAAIIYLERLENLDYVFARV